MNRQLMHDELADARAYAESRASEETEAALRIFFRACADVLADALKREMKEAEHT
ncbi:hypothetical protein KUV28_17490 [Ferrimonas balearica]|nr:hypothetical protein [Ferrimonas balearica]